MEDLLLNMSKGIAIHWFRQDLRIKDNPSLEAASQYESIIPVYILDDVNSGEFAMGAASRWWLHKSLEKLNESLGGNLLIYKGNPSDIFNNIMKEQDISYISWNRCYEPWRIDRDKAIKKDLESQNINVESFSGALLWEPWKISKDDGTPYRVFTPFYKKGCLNADEPRLPTSSLKLSNLYTNKLNSESIENLDLIPEIDWYRDFEPEWSPGEEGADRCLEEFLESGLLNYKEGRNFPSKKFVSRLSPHLHFGEIAPLRIFTEVMKSNIDEKNKTKYLSEIGWRDFSYNLLFNYPEMTDLPIQSKFEKFPWQKLANQNLCKWHNLSRNKIKNKRNLKINAYEKKIFFKNLNKIGYSNIDRLKYKNNLVKAFQRKFRQNLINGKIDKECLLISNNLVKF